MIAEARVVSGRTLALAILIGSCALLVLGVHPVLLGALVQEGRLADAQVGNLVTIEMLAIVTGSGDLGGLSVEGRDDRPPASLLSPAPPEALVRAAGGAAPVQ